MNKISIIILGVILFGCGHERKIASESNKTYLGELLNYSEDLNCDQLQNEVEGQALKHCIKNEFYKAELLADIKCPKGPSKNLLFGAFLLGVSPKAPIKYKFSCSKSYDDAIKELPEKIYFRNKTENFNTNNEFVIKDGIIWHRRRNSNLWKPLPLHPDLATPKEIGTDSEHFVAIDESGQIFSIKDKALNDNITEKDWRKTWGSPLWTGPGMQIPPAIKKSWEISFFSPSEDEYYVDSAGNKHGIGVGCSSLYVLSKDGQRITYLDPWLPSDLSYEICGPMRGLFLSEKLSASGSTIFVINKYGDMYTRNYDFDISGGNDLILNYTYEYKKQATSENPLFYEPLFTQRVLSTKGWEKQPKINGKITDNISIYKGKEKDRVLRVEGENANGENGYFEKGIKEKEWKFFVTEKPLQGNDIDNSEKDKSDLSLGEDESKKFILKSSGYKMEVVNFHPYCSPAELRVTFSSGKTLDLKLHTRETVRQFPRERGLNMEPLPLNGAIEVPKDLSDLGPQEREFIVRFFKGKRFTNISAAVTLDNLVIYGQEGMIKNILDTAFLKPVTKFFPPISATFTWNFKRD